MAVLVDLEIPVVIGLDLQKWSAKINSCHFNNKSQYEQFFKFYYLPSDSTA